jgi:hypothetical protein
VLLFKSLKNHRPASQLLQAAIKKIITIKLTAILDENHTPEQVGFCSGFNDTDYLQTINQVMEKAEEFCLKIYMAFIDCS